MMLPSMNMASEAKLNHMRDFQEVQLARTSGCLRFMLPSDMMMSTDIQFTNSSVSALDICLMSFGDARTMSARIADQADYGLLIPVRIAARIHYVSPRPARRIDGLTEELTDIKN
ncbi:hypothetical protein L3X38_001895 [Prunus dulcis]|uniref:Uncharacterized protein n=1 Tax=Prunus dulcis TaxID=3755 RepID=A0AAD4WSZ2_PRUDU|nr:hypothetical protein L3X38_001895 [Prunus dulcis]